MEQDLLRKHNEDVLSGKRKFNHKILTSIVIGPILAGLALFIYSSVMDTDGSNALNQTISWILFGIFVPTLILALFSMQKFELVGSYGETIILLIPTFIWLLPTHDEAMWWITITAFILAALTFTSLVISLILIKTKNKNLVNRVVSSTLAMRFTFIFASIASTLLISIILIWWGQNSLGLIGVNSKGEAISSNKEWIGFIAAITIFVAGTLIALGLFSRFKEMKKTYIKKINKIKNSSEVIQKTQVMNVKKSKNIDKKE